MDKNKIKLDILMISIPYFDDLFFNCFGNEPRYQGTIRNKIFNGYYGIQYHHAGRLIFSINEKPPLTVEHPCAFLTYPGAVFHYATPENETRHHVYLCFHGERMQRYLGGGFFPINPENPLIRITRPEHFLATMEELQKNLEENGCSHPAPRAVLLLEDLLLQLQEQQDAPHLKVNAFCEQRIRLVRDSILREPQKPHDFEQEARLLSISYSHFRKLFHDVTGYSPTRFQNEARLKLAEKLLTRSALPLNEVAELCGFDDPFYFSRLFKKYRHITPSGCRREFSAV